jgi:hypothetical protein
LRATVDGQITAGDTTERSVGRGFTSISRLS